MSSAPDSAGKDRMMEDDPLPKPDPVQYLKLRCSPVVFWDEPSFQGAKNGDPQVRSGPLAHKTPTIGSEGGKKVVRKASK